MSHYLDVVMDSDGPVLVFRCDAEPGELCRRRPADWEHRDAWTEEEATETGFECWAQDFVGDLGMEAFFGTNGTVFGSVPIEITYDSVGAIEVDVIEVKPPQPKPITPTLFESNPFAAASDAVLAIEIEQAYARRDAVRHTIATLLRERARRVRREGIAE